ncbi:hypothetical protein KY290_024730 [Solanum tuberosum]|uniref:Uncharacterized protein n=1 Tax=Solanum tuberosum TaxID=4113 RepID=A0ABQ7URH5_SOLTU|nr:hypothetical protein KY284_023586 [Solanum tuberosum]KAH0754460.1 hypothetical protein KY290_024730 [Solanum tuberosum]
MPNNDETSKLKHIDQREKVNSRWDEDTYRNNREHHPKNLIKLCQLPPIVMFGGGVVSMCYCIAGTRVEICTRHTIPALRKTNLTLYGSRHDDDHQLPLRLFYNTR